ncbi:MAG: nucleotidyltransferase domain-containing protein [Acidobacteriota bacterium]
MTVEEIVRNRLGVEPERIAEFCRKWQIKELALFGSALGDDFRPDSDVDLLVTFQDPHRSFGPWMGELQEMEEELQRMFVRKVDFVEKRLVKNPFRRHHILTTRQVIYAA